jgi:hypothetical protein
MMRAWRELRAVAEREPIGVTASTGVVIGEQKRTSGEERTVGKA